MIKISRRTFFARSASAAAFYLTGCSPQRGGRRPNVIFVLTDDQRWDAISSLPDSARAFPALRTPNLDRLAAEGARFANAFVPTSICSPSRASFLSGVYPHVHGVQDNFSDYPVQRIPSYHSILEDAGYQTAYVGKWHMGEGDDSHRPPFDYWVSHAGQGHYHDTEFNISETINSTQFNLQGERQVLEGYYTHVVTDLVVDWLKSATPPFSLQLGHKAPHGKWFPETKYQSIYDDIQVVKPSLDTLIGPRTPAWVRERVNTWHGINGPLYEHYDYGEFIRSYYATIPSIDDSVGEIYETLRQMGELDNTVFIFAGDNGFLLGEKASIDKRTAWEESIRIPLLIRYPEAIEAGRVVDQMVLNLDLPPTLFELTGTQGTPQVQGRSVMPIVRGDSEDWRTSWYYAYDFEQQFPYTPNVRAVRTADWKYIHYPNGEGQPDTELAELYDLAEDPKEQNNLINDPAYAEKQAELEAELRRLQEELGATPDRMPVNPKLSFEMPEETIR